MSAFRPRHDPWNQNGEALTPTTDAPRPAHTTVPFLPFHRPSIGDEEIRGVLEVLQSGWLTTGPRVKEFERRFAEFIGSQTAIAVSSCTAALQLALDAIGVAEGDEVILPTMTFASTGAVVMHLRATPVLVDCANDSFHIDVQAVEKAITPHTKAIVPVHYSGQPCDMECLTRVARAHGVLIIEDAAHALPSRYNGQMIGTIGDITCFSFYATKTVTCGEGGMITTDNAEYAERVRILSLHGISREAWKRYSAEGSWRYEIEALGYKNNLTDIQAALGLAQMNKCESMRTRRELLAARYTEALSSLEAFALPEVPQGIQHAWHLYVAQVNSDTLSITRDELIEELRDRRIGTSVHFIPLHLHVLYRKRFGYRPGHFPNAEKRFSAAISLPLFPDMTFEEQDRVVEALHEIVRLHRR